MNLELSDEQIFLRDAARDALSRTNTLEAAREALEARTSPAAAGEPRPDLWATAVEAGWTGLLVAEERGGAGLSAFDAMLVMQEAGRGLSGVELLGHLPASALLDAAGHEGVDDVAAGSTRAAFAGAQPPGDLDDGWTVDARSGLSRVPAPGVDASGAVTGEVAWVVDAPGADLLVIAATRVDDGAPVAVVVDASATGVSVEDVFRYDATRRLGHVRLDGAAGTVLDVGGDGLSRAWHLAQALLAAESVGAVDRCLEMAVQYAKERFTFGRPIGSYQAVKHALVEILRRGENARSLLYYAGWSYESAPEEFVVAACAARSAAGEALDFAARANISVHGGIGATWEHDAPLYFRRAQLSRRLLGGAGAATDRVAGELLHSHAPMAAPADAGRAESNPASAATSVEA